jgi:hypothetical protein
MPDSFFQKSISRPCAISYSLRNRKERVSSDRYSYFVPNVRYVNSPAALTYFQDYFSVRREKPGGGVR